eukprot:SAG11_NODE_7072_length_1198_cov_1.648772_2_plen_66_part_00
MPVAIENVQALAVAGIITLIFCCTGGGSDGDITDLAVDEPQPDEPEPEEPEPEVEPKGKEEKKAD